MVLPRRWPRMLRGIAVLLLIACIPFGRQYADAHRFTAQAGQTLAFHAYAGDKVLVRLPIPRDTGGRWAAPGGLRFTAAGQRPQTVLAPSDPDWSLTPGDTTLKDVTAAATLTVPPGSGTVTGEITGTVEYPQADADVRDPISIPVTITVVPRPFWTTALTVNLLAVLLVLIALIRAGSAVRAARGKQLAYRDTRRQLGYENLGRRVVDENDDTDTARSVLPAVLGGVICGGGVVVLFMGVQSAAGLYTLGLSPAPGLWLPIWLMPLAFGVAPAVAVFSNKYYERPRHAAVEDSPRAPYA